MKWKIPLYRITTDEEDFKNIKKVLQRKMDWAIGPEIPEFENELGITINEFIKADVQSIEENNGLLWAKKVFKTKPSIPIKNKIVLTDK